MTRFGKYLRIANARSERVACARFPVTVRQELRDSLQRLASEDNMSPNAVIEALLRGYVSRHPAALAMVDQFVRDVEGRDGARAPAVSPRLRDEIYAEIGDNLTEE